MLTSYIVLLIESWLLPLSAIKLGRKIGHGGFGTVYLSDLNGTLVAIKQIKDAGNLLNDDHIAEIQALG